MRRTTFGALAGLVAGAIIVAILLAGPHASARLLVVPDPASGVDAAATLQSATAIARHLARVVGSGDFATKVAASDAGVSGWVAEMQGNWPRHIQATAGRTGQITLVLTDRDRDHALRLAQAAADTLKSRGGEYVPGRVTILLLDPPTLGWAWPSWKMLLAVIMAGIVGGLAGWGVRRRRGEP